MRLISGLPSGPLVGRVLTTSARILSANALRAAPLQRASPAARHFSAGAGSDPATTGDASRVITVLTPPQRRSAGHSGPPSSISPNMTFSDPKIESIMRYYTEANTIYWSRVRTYLAASRAKRGSWLNRENSRPHNELMLARRLYMLAINKCLQSLIEVLSQAKDRTNKDHIVEVVLDAHEHIIRSNHKLLKRCDPADVERFVYLSLELQSIPEHNPRLWKSMQRYMKWEVALPPSFAPTALAIFRRLTLSSQCKLSEKLDSMLWWISTALSQLDSLQPPLTYVTWHWVIEKRLSKQLIDDLYAHYLVSRRKLGEQLTKAPISKEHEHQLSCYGITAISILIYYQQLGMVSTAKRIAHTIFSGLPLRIRHIDRDVWTEITQAQLSLETLRPLDFVLPRLLIVHRNVTLPRYVDKLTQIYEAIDSDEARSWTDRLIELRIAQSDWVLYKETPSLVIEQLFRTRSLYDILLLLFKSNCLDSMGEVQRLMVDKIYTLSPEDRLQLFGQLFSDPATFSPMDVIILFQRLAEYSKSTVILKDICDYITKHDPRLLMYLDTDKLIIWILYMKVYEEYNANMHNKLKKVSLSQMWETTVTLLRYITTTKRQLIECDPTIERRAKEILEDHESMARRQAYLSGSLSKDFMENFVVNPFFSRLILPLSRSVERVLCRECLRRGIDIHWRSMGTILYSKVKKNQPEEAHQFIINRLRTIPRTNLVMLRQDSYFESMNGSFYPFILNTYSFLGKQDITRFMFWQLVEGIQRYGLLEPNCYKAMVSILMDAMGYDMEKSIEDLEQEWERIKQYGKDMATRKVHKPQVVIQNSYQRIAINSYKWSHRRYSVYGLNSNNYCSYIEALMRKGGFKKAMHVLFNEMPKVGVTPSPKLLRSMLSYFDAADLQFEMTIILLYFEKNWPKLLVTAYHTLGLSENTARLIKKSIQAIKRK